jgi:glutaredoxin 3
MNAKLKSYLKDAALLTITVVIALVLGSQAPKWYKAWKGPFKRGEYAEHVKSMPYKLTLYGTSTCPHCEAARNYLKQAGIPFNDMNLDKSPVANEAFKKLGEQAVPVLVNENMMLVGFQQEAYVEMAKSSSKF